MRIRSTLQVSSTPSSGPAKETGGPDTGTLEPKDNAGSTEPQIFLKLLQIESPGALHEKEPVSPFTEAHL